MLTLPSTTTSHAEPGYTFVTCYQPGIKDPKAERLKHLITHYFHLQIDEVTISQVYTIKLDFTGQELEKVQNALIDPACEMLDPGNRYAWADHTVEVSFKPGITDSVVHTLQTMIQDCLGRSFADNESVSTAIRYYFKGNLSRREIDLISKQLLANELIHDINSLASHPASVNDTQDTLPVQQHQQIIPNMLNMCDAELLSLSQSRCLALNLDEMRTIRDYYKQTSTQTLRQHAHMPAFPTDVELEALAQTWSEHCKHKIFNAKIHYHENGKIEVIDSLFKTYIKKATQHIAQNVDWLVSVFDDNAGIINFNLNYDLAFKVETHNSPSALDPYHGALTGILGVNRDILGTGICTRPIANTNVLCFANPHFTAPLPPRLHHPKRVFEGVRLGIEHGGNKSGIPTVNGAIVFDNSYLGKPLVYCGTAGIIPKAIHGKKSSFKTVLPNDKIIVVGGKTGRDGIHGSTFSSQALQASSPSSAVQIGDPYTQKKLTDFLLEARDQELFRCLTDNGAGGLSSSVGEMALLSNGCELYLDRVPLKCATLEPWEILVSESQERMTLVADPEKIDPLIALAKHYELSIAEIGHFTNCGFMHVFYENKSVALLEMEFLHHGVPQMELQAEWFAFKNAATLSGKACDHRHDLHRLLRRLNICSKETIIRQYDHEVQAGTMLKPLVGVANDGPSDASVLQPIELQSTCEGIVIANGICPRYSRRDTYHMAANAIDEALRNCVAVGCNPARIAILDNFCWPDPIYHQMNTPDGKFKLAQLVRANKALYDTAIAFGTPIISGKDSMKNDYVMDEIKISVVPTLLISAIGKIDDIHCSTTMDLKQSGDLLYLIGITKNELAESEYAQMKNECAEHIPVVNCQLAKKIYHNLHQAIRKKLVHSCHDCSDGGFAVALAEKAFAGGLGVYVDLDLLPCDGQLEPWQKLFSESASRLIVSIPHSNKVDFETLLGDIPFACIGTVRSDERFIIHSADTILIDDTIDSLKHSWQEPLKQEFIQ